MRFLYRLLLYLLVLMSQLSVVFSLVMINFTCFRENEPRNDK